MPPRPRSRTTSQPAEIASASTVACGGSGIVCGGAADAARDARSRVRGEPGAVAAADRRQRAGQRAASPTACCSTPAPPSRCQASADAVDRRVGRAGDRRGERARGAEQRRAGAEPERVQPAHAEPHARLEREPVERRVARRRCRAAARSTAPAARARGRRRAPTATPNAGLAGGDADAGERPDREAEHERREAEPEQQRRRGSTRAAAA